MQKRSLIVIGLSHCYVRDIKDGKAYVCRLHDVKGLEGKWIDVEKLPQPIGKLDVVFEEGSR